MQQISLSGCYNRSWRFVLHPADAFINIYANITAETSHILIVILDHRFEKKYVNAMQTVVRLDTAAINEQRVQHNEVFPIPAPSVVANLNRWRWNWNWKHIQTGKHIQK